METNEIVERRKDDLFKNISEALLKEFKRQRRFMYVRTVFFSLVFVFIIFQNFTNGSLFNKGITIPKGEEYVSMVRIQGVIKPSSEASVETIEQQLTKAFHDKKSKGVLLLINSPGGTVVQSLLLKELIEDLKKETEKPVMIYAEDIMASGGYMIALAGDVIYITESTITGSIGVIQQSFGAYNFLEKVGIEPRTIYSGEHKNRMSTFNPMDEDDLEKASYTTKLLHENFITLVKESRKDKLSTEKAIFSGDYWIGKEALELGLVDGVESLNTALENYFQTTNKVDYTKKSPVYGFNRFMSISFLKETLVSSFNDWQTVLPK